MLKVNLFLDSSALVAGIVSPTGAARALLLLAETSQITITVSQQVIAESERAIARKIPQALPELRQAIRTSKVKIVQNPSPSEVRASLNLIQHPADVPILLAAKNAHVDFLVTLNRKHFIDNPEVARLTGLRIGTPGDGLEWLRNRISTSEG